MVGSSGSIVSTGRPKKFEIIQALNRFSYNKWVDIPWDTHFQSLRDNNKSPQSCEIRQTPFNEGFICWNPFHLIRTTCNVQNEIIILPTSDKKHWLILVETSMWRLQNTLSVLYF